MRRQPAATRRPPHIPPRPPARRRPDRAASPRDIRPTAAWCSRTAAPTKAPSAPPTMDRRKVARPREAHHPGGNAAPQADVAFCKPHHGHGNSPGGRSLPPGLFSMVSCAVAIRMIASETSAALQVQARRCRRWRLCLPPAGMAVRHNGLKLLRFFTRHALVRATSGMASLQSLNASWVQAARASGVSAAAGPT